MSTIELYELEGLIYEREQRILKEQRQAFKDARPRISRDTLMSDFYKCESNNVYGNATGFGTTPEDAYAKWWLCYQEIKIRWCIESPVSQKRKWWELWKLF